MSTDDTKRTVMLACLEIAVPLAIERMRRIPPSDRKAAARHILETISSRGDAILYREGQGRGDATHGFGRVAYALAILALAPGGVTWLGTHWCDAWPCPGHEDQETAA